MELLLTPPSDWVRRWAALVPPGGTVLDVACGSGRHVRWLAAQGFRVTGVDRDATAVQPLREMAEIVVADIEAGPWPFAGRRFDAVVVTNYLWRPLLPAIVDSVGGLLVYETFMLGHEGKPSNPQFLLRPGELLEACAALQPVAFEQGRLDAPVRTVQRLAAARDAGARFPLQPPAGAPSGRA